MKDWAIVVDTTFNEELYDLDDLFFIPIEITSIDKITKDIKIYKDYVDLKPDVLLDLIRKKNTLQTSQIPQEVFREKAIELLKKYKKVIFLTLSKGLTKQFDSLLLVEKELNTEFGEERVIALDTRAASMLGVYMTKSVMSKLKNNPNVSKQELQLLVDSIFNKARLQCLVTDVNFLINGGRLTGLKAFLAKTLDLKIIVELNDVGGIDKLDQDRDIYKALDKIWKNINVKLNTQVNRIREVHLISLWTEKECVDYLNYIQSKITDQNIIIKHKYMPTTIASHTGEVLAICVITE